MQSVAVDDAAEKILKTVNYCAEQDFTAAIASAKLAHQLLDKIIDFLKPGVRESEARQFALDVFASHGIERTWHPPYVRFGKHTLLTFRDKSQEDLVLQEEDIAFLDIGIVKEGVEGDAGRTVTFGSNKEFERISAASKQIFDEAIAFWNSKNPSGIELYDFIYMQAEKHDVLWNLDPAGHLIGAFPHRGWKHGINHFPQAVEQGKWILEIQIRHKELPIGAFFEDLLYHP